MNKRQKIEGVLFLAGQGIERKEVRDYIVDRYISHFAYEIKLDSINNMIDELIQYCEQTRIVLIEKNSSVIDLVYNKHIEEENRIKIERKKTVDLIIKYKTRIERNKNRIERDNNIIERLMQLLQFYNQ
jgi:uncharacterized protein Smg (DUF494 family)